MTDSELLLHDMARVSRGLTILFDAKMRQAGITAARARVLLALLEKAGPVAQSELTTSLRIEGPTAVKIIDGLEGLGYVERLPDPKDRRAKLVALTTQGVPVARAALREAESLGPLVLAGIPDHDLRVLKRALDKIRCNLEHLSATVITPASIEAAA